MSAAVVIVIASCWRLAKFNVDSRPAEGFLGLPTPFNAMFWASLVMAATKEVQGFYGPDQPFARDLASNFFSGWIVVATVAFVLGVLMLSSLPLPSLKFKHMKWKGNEVVYCLLATAACLLLLYGILAVPLILLLYLLSPLWGKLFPKQPTRI